MPILKNTETTSERVAAATRLHAIETAARERRPMTGAQESALALIARIGGGGWKHR